MADTADWLPLLLYFCHAGSLVLVCLGVVCGGLLFHGEGTVGADVLLMSGVAAGLCFVALAVVLVAWLLVAFAGVGLALFGFATGGWYKNKEAGATCVAPAP